MLTTQLEDGRPQYELIIKTSQLNDRDFLYVCCTKDVTEHKTLQDSIFFLAILYWVYIANILAVLSCV